MTVRQILNEKGSSVISVRDDTSILRTAKLMKDKRIGAVLVVDSAGQMCGVLSERDIVRALPDEGESLLTKPVSVLMSRDVITCKGSMAIADMMALMTEKRIRHVPVVEDGHLKGIISIGDVVKFRIRETESEAQALKAYIATG